MREKNIIFVGKPERRDSDLKILLKSIFKQMGCEGVHCIHHWDLWRSLVNKTVNFRVTEKLRISWLAELLLACKEVLCCV